MGKLDADKVFIPSPGKVADKHDRYGKRWIGLVVLLIAGAVALSVQKQQQSKDATYPPDGPQEIFGQTLAPELIACPECERCGSGIEQILNADFQACLFSASRLDKSVDRLERLEVCLHVAREARKQHAPVHLAISLSYYESRFHPVVESDKGAVGPLQAIPRYWCPDGKREGCDVVAAGIRALLAFLDRYEADGLVESIARYNYGIVGDCPPKSVSWAREVVSFSKRLESNRRRWLAAKGG